jgi:hypothetical protein
VAEQPNATFHLPAERIEHGTQFSDGDQLDLHRSRLERVDIARQRIEKIVGGSLAERAVGGLNAVAKTEADAKNKELLKVAFATAWLEYSLKEETELDRAA